jgi:formamidopyrimidine-DNA glycosylase
MPELPEVETIRRGLAERLSRQTITGVRVRQAQLRHLVDVAALQELVVGRTITSVDRRAKYLLVRLQPDYVLILHLGMTGRLWVGPPADQDALHDHLIFSLGPELELRFHDTRRFGMCFLTTEAELLQHPRLRHLGPEPLSEAFSGAYLLECARGLHKPVKNFVMDAAVVVGVGNIYASESLFLAGLRPTRAVGRLRLQHWERLCLAVKQVLQAAIDHHGTSFSDYVDSEGRQGNFQNQLLVYGRDGAPCRQDGHLIKRIVQAGRSSYYCPGCQR